MEFKFIKRNLVLRIKHNDYNRDEYFMDMIIFQLEQKCNCNHSIPYFTSPICEEIIDIIHKYDIIEMHRNSCNHLILADDLNMLEELNNYIFILKLTGKCLLK